jgi:hypothetical protein
MTPNDALQSDALLSAVVDFGSLSRMERVELMDTLGSEIFTCVKLI